MEMEAPRRSAADRSREPSMKKPRLSEDSSAAAAAAAASTGDRIRPYAQARPAAASSYPRFRANEREREDSEETGRGGTSYQQQQEELVAQYKTALAELTFNSKPIITNLTIIAGENLHAAKAVASAVCANILEVPIEQKLPSLYLLDSIVKNIGRDYIKYFAARLPEVFCKAYKQVDPSIHSSMRHLFGTWKGIFSSSCLQLIEKDLGFSPIINGSSGGTVTRSDTQGQRPSHSIHVNPKYLEAARQRIQQSARGKDFSGEDVNDAIAPSDDAERSFRIPTSENMRQWSELSNKIHNVQRPQREQLNEFIHERKGYKDVRATVGSTHPSRQLDLVLGETIDRTKESVEPDKPYAGAGGITDSTAYGRNGFDAIHTYGRYRDSGSTPNDSQLPMVHLNSSNKMNWSTSKNWKNSEEEEYIWDDTGSRSADYEGPKSSWSTDDQDKPASLQNHKLMSMETEQLNSRQNKFDVFQPLTKDAGMEERIPFRRDYDDHHSLHRNSHDIVTRIDKSAWAMHDTPQSAFGLDRFSSRASSQPEGRITPVSGVLSTNDNSALPRSGFQSSTLPSSMVPSMDLIGTGGTLGLQKQLPLQSPSPSVPLVPSVPHQQQKPRSLVDQNYPPVHLSHVNQKSILLAGQFNRDSSTPIINDAFPILSENPGQQGHTSVNAQPTLMHASQLSSFPFPDLKRHLSSLQQSQSDPSVQAVQKETSTPVSQGLRANQSKGFSGARHSNSSIDVSGLSSTSNLLAATKKADLLPNNSSSGMWNLNIQPPLPSGPPPTQAQTSSSPLATSSAEMPSSHGTAPSSLALSLQGVLPPLPPGPPPSSSLSGASPQTTNSASIGLNPLSSLLSSLVAKGLITSTSTQLPTVSPIQMAKESPSQNSDLDGTTSSTPSSLKELPVSEPSTPGGVSLVSSTTTFDNLIGVQFKSEIVREFHSFVIDSLLDDLNHQCYECGLRFRHDEQLLVHMDWHNLKNSELSSTIKMYRRWYSSIINWVSGDVELACGPSLEAAPSEQPWEPMVTADEMQSICALCGEPFEDFYSVEKDEWMYKRTVYLNLMDAKCVAGGMNGSKVQGPIVHAKCISTSTDGGVGQQS